MPTAAATDESPPIPGGDEKALATFLSILPADHALQARTLVHAWSGGGGSFAAGRLVTRLLGTDRQGNTFTAATLRGSRSGGYPRMEIARVLLESHGVAHDDWVHWSDEFADLIHHDFDPSTRFPTLTLDDKVTDSELARLAVGLRDLAQMMGA